MPAAVSHRPRVAAVLIAGALALAGCAPGNATAPSSPAAPPAAETPATTEAPTAPVLMPDGTAEENLPVFRSVMDQVWAGEQRVEGRAYIDALTVAGFDRAAMQVTPDRTSVGDPVDAIQFSVRWSEETCLVGQIGPSTPVPTAVVVAPSPSGACLIGLTRPIDW